MKTLKLQNSKLETIDSTNQITTSTARFTMNIAKNREVTIKNERDDIADYKVFSDGSGQEEGIEALAIMRNSMTTQVTSILPGHHEEAQHIRSRGRRRNFSHLDHTEFTGNHREKGNAIH